MATKKMENKEKSNIKEESGFFRRAWELYADGFRSMTIGRYLWAIILVKLALIFLLFRMFFFPDVLERDYDNDEDRAQAVRTTLIDRK